MSARPGSFREAAAAVAVAVIAYAGADVTHELLGHAVVARLRGVQILSISSVALQTATSIRAVAAAGTLADLFAGALALLLVRRSPPMTMTTWCAWLFGTVSLMNVGYLVFSGLLNNGDWSVVIAGQTPEWAWRLGLVVAGAALYAGVVLVAAGSPAEWVNRGDVSLDQFGRQTLTAYLAGGALLTTASSLNPIGFRLVLVSGLAGSFALTAGLLAIPPRVAALAASPHADGIALPLNTRWAVAAIVTAVAFVGLLGPGVHWPR